MNVLSMSISSLKLPMVVLLLMHDSNSSKSPFNAATRTNKCELFKYSRSIGHNEFKSASDGINIAYDLHRQYAICCKISDGKL